MSPQQPTAVPPAVSPSDGFEAGVLEFAGKLRAFVRRRVSNPEDAEDLSQEVMMKVFRSRDSLRDPSKLESWLYQVARGALIDYYRRKRPSEPVPEGLSAEEHSFDEIGAVLGRSARRFLQTLPDLYRTPLELAELQGLSIAEIAARLKLGQSAVKSRLQRGRVLLRDKMLACCQFEYDPNGKVIDYHQRGPCACKSECGGPVAQVQASTVAGRTLPPLHYELGREQDAQAILGLLRGNGLPTEDLNSEKLLNFVTARSSGRLLGCAGVEPHGAVGLLRSVAVCPGLQGLGLGAELVVRAEQLAVQLGLAELWLLTTTAPGFFARRGYSQTDRSEVPAGVRGSSEFRTVCPASAIVMRKVLA